MRGKKIANWIHIKGKEMSWVSLFFPFLFLSFLSPAHVYIYFSSFPFPCPALLPDLDFMTYSLVPFSFYSRFFSKLSSKFLPQMLLPLHLFSNLSYVLLPLSRPPPLEQKVSQMGGGGRSKTSQNVMFFPLKSNFFFTLSSVASVVSCFLLHSSAQLWGR